MPRHMTLSSRGEARGCSHKTKQNILFSTVQNKLFIMYYQENQTGKRRQDRLRTLQNAKHLESILKGKIN